MEYKEAKEFVQKFKESISIIERHSSNFDAIKSRYERLEIENKALKKEVSELKSIKKMFNLLSRNSNIEICRQCNGEGGHCIDMGEQGCEGEECGECLGSGFSEKQVAQ